MKKFFNWSLVVGACVAAFYLIGLIVPRNEASGSKSNLESKPEAVYAIFSDVDGWPQWYPGVARVEEREKRKNNAVWSVTDKLGKSYVLEVTQNDPKENSFAATYELDGTRHNWTMIVNWFPDGARVRVNEMTDTGDPWKRARRFLMPNHDVAPLEVLLAIGKQLNVKVTPEKERQKN